MLARVDSRELAEWAAYERVHGPLGGTRDDVLNAILATVIHNAWSKRAKKVKDFLPEWDHRPQTPADQLEMVRVLNQMFGGEEVDRGDDR